MKLETTSQKDGKPDASSKKIAIVSADFYPELATQMVESARRAARDCGVSDDDITHIAVPGCFELPVAIQRLLRRDDIDAIAAIGIVIRGETPHFDFVAGECARGIMTLQITSGVPIGFGVLTTNTLEQAQERADPARGDKGYEAMIAALSVLGIAEKTTTPAIGFRR